MNKPVPPIGYKMLVEGQHTTTPRDLIWMVDSQRQIQRWGHSILQTEEGLKVASDTNQLYKEPKQVEDYCFFRCRKIGNERTQNYYSNRRS